MSTKHARPWMVFCVLLLFAAPAWAGSLVGEGREDCGQRVEEQRQVSAAVSRGWAFLKENREEEAEMIFHRILQLRPDETQAVAGLEQIRKSRSLRKPEGWRLLKSGDYEAAAAAFRRDLEEHPHWSVLHNGLAWSCFWAGRKEEAEAAFAAALLLDPGLSTALTGRQWVRQWRLAPLRAAWASLEAREYSRAAREFQEILEDSSSRLPREERWRVYEGLGWAFHGQQEYGWAEYYLRKSLEGQPGNSQDR